MERTPQQIEAIETITSRLCVEAGAGSGKTRVLVDRIAHLIATRQADLDEIVAITFTDKAAAEMKDRLRRTFRMNAPRDNPQEMNRWRDLERRMDAARISTIHAFCAALLRENALFIGLDPDFTVLAEAEAALLLDQAARQTVHGLLEQEDAGAMRLAVAYPLDTLHRMILEALKKPALLERLDAAHPLHDPEALAAHWRRIAAEEYRRRLGVLGQRSIIRHYLCRLRSFDGLCTQPADGRETKRQMMIDTLEKIRKSNDPEMIELALVRFTEKWPQRGAKKNWPSDEVYAALSKTQNAIKKRAQEVLQSNALLRNCDESRAARLSCDAFAVAQATAAAYQAAKAQARAMDYEDLINAARHALRDYPELRRRLARGMRHLLVDEFQDTDATQLEIIRLIAEPGGGAAGPALFFVGDAKQSIYLFRGAEVEVFQREKAAATHVTRMNRNFRSLPDVLTFVNDFFERSGRLHAVERYAPMVAHRTALGQPRIEFILPETPETKMGEKPLSEDWRRAEAKLVAARILALCDPNNPVVINDPDTHAPRPAHYGDVAILLRALTSVHLYEQALRDAGIPYALVAGKGFYAQQEVADVLTLLALLTDPRNDVAALSFLRSPLCAVSDDTVYHLGRDRSLSAAFWGDALPENEDDAEALRAARAMMRDLRDRMEAPLPDFLRAVLDKTGCEAVLLGGHLGLQKASNVRKLIDLAEDFARRRPPGLRAFVRYLREVGRQELREGEALLQPQGAGAVTLMTIHKAKGLEFPVVFVVDMGSPPKGARHDPLLIHRDLGLALRADDDTGRRAPSAIVDAITQRIREEEENEHARLLYVALTRARDHLVMSGSLEGKNSGSWLEAIDDEFAVVAQAHRAVLKGNGWRAIVHRRLEASTHAPRAAAHEATPPPEVLARQVQPLALAAAPSHTIPVSAVLRHMGAEEDKDMSVSAKAVASPERRAGGAQHWALQRGTLAHRMFECWDFREDMPPLAAILAEAGLGLSRRAAAADDLRAMAERFAASDLRALLARQQRLEREAPFYLCVDDAVISGTVDAVLDDGIILDYKTGQYSDRVHEHYTWQIRLYAAAFRRLRGVQAPAGIIAYVDEGMVKRVPLSEADEAAVIESVRKIVRSWQPVS